METVRKAGFVHSGGDTPISNGPLWGLICGCAEQGVTLLGYPFGWEGVRPKKSRILDPTPKLFGIHAQSGIITGSSRYNPLKKEGGVAQLIQQFKADEIKWGFSEAGDDGIHVARACHDAGLNWIHIAKTIDDDLPETEITFGAWSARDLAASVVRNLHATIKSHRMVLVVQFMGRGSGKLTLYGGLASACHLILIPEFPKWTLADLAKAVKEVHAKFGYVMIAIAEELNQSELQANKKKIEQLIGEPPKDPSGHRLISKELVGNAELLGNALESRTGFECRAQVLARICRSGPPSAFDVALGTEMGLHAADLMAQGQAGRVVVVKKGRVTSIPIERIKLGKTRGVTKAEYQRWLRLAPVRFPEI